MKVESLWVLVFEHDTAAAYGLRMLSQRDCRVASCEIVSDPQEFIQTARQMAPAPDLIFVDGEYEQSKISLQDLLLQLRKAQPQAKMICLVNHPAADLLRDAVTGGANGLFVKSDISLGLIHGAFFAKEGRFLYTASAEAYLPPQQVAGRKQYVSVPSWRPHPDLAPHAHEVFYDAIVEGVSNKTIARRLDRSVSAIDKCIGRCYDTLIGTNWVDWRAIEGVDLDQFSKEEQAYLFYTGLPQSWRGQARREAVTPPWNGFTSAHKPA